MTQKKIVIAALLIVLLPSLVFLGWLSLVRLHHSHKPTTLPTAQTILHSNRPDGAVIIPFRTEYKHKFFTTILHKRTVANVIFQQMFVTVQIGNTEMMAEVDTGGSNISWPAGLRLGPISKHNAAMLGDGGGNRVTGDLSILDSIHIGGLELNHVPTLALRDTAPETAHDPYPKNLLVLGDEAFAGLVLTIDYPNQELILHPAGFQPPKSASVYPCVPTDTNDLTHAYVPAILASVEGQKAWAAVDTGWTDSSIGISVPLYHKLKVALVPQKEIEAPHTSHFAFGLATTPSFPRLHWTLPGIAGKSMPGSVVRNIAAHQDIIFGSVAFSDYQVTIDYPGKRVWLEAVMPSPKKHIPEKPSFRAKMVTFWSYLPFRFLTYTLLGLLVGMLWVHLNRQWIHAERRIARLNYPGWAALLLLIGTVVHIVSFDRAETEETWFEASRLFLFFSLGCFLGGAVVRRLASSRTKAARIAILLTLVIVLTLGWVGLVWVHRSLQPRPLPPMQHILHSQRPDQAVIIPFHTKLVRTFVKTTGHKPVVTHAVFTEQIFVTVQIGTRMVEAKVDTGSPDNGWPSTLNLGPISDPDAEDVSDDVGNTVSAGLSILDNIRLGDLELRHVPTYAEGDPRQMPTLTNQENVLTLGDAAFKGLVLTIDYAKKELIVRPAGYQPPPSALVYPCTWLQTDAPTDIGVPAIWGSVEGQKALAIIDTGWSGNSIALSPQMYQKILPELRRKKILRESGTFDGEFGQASSTDISRLQWTFSRLSGSSPAIVLTNRTLPQDMVLGHDVLSQFRVTIDYPGKRVWLERPVPSGSTSQTANR